MSNSHDQSWKPTACILCESNCGIEVQTDDNQIKKIRGDKRHPATEGYLCQKASRLNHYQNSRHRITSPLRRKPDGSYEEISWDTAISEIAAKLSSVKENHGGDKIFYYGGGGQGNHLPGAYSRATLSALGVKYKSTAIAQEKTGEIYVNSRMFGAGFRGDFEHCEVALFLGKNPWQSHGIPRARVVLKEIQKDPERKMIVIDPRLSETAEMADYHLAVKPGADAWLIAAILGEIVQCNGIDQQWVAEHTDGLEQVLPYLTAIPVAQFAEHAGIEHDTVKEVAAVISKAQSVAVFEDLGVQMNRHSTLVSYLEKLIWVLTGNLGNKGGQYSPTMLGPIATFNAGKIGKTPVVGAPIISGLVPCNVITEEILTDHPDRYRAMIVESGNPVHSLADSNRMRKALRSLECVVVIDIAMTETAREADYVLPAATQFEKAEATFFNFEFPDNCFQLRHPIFEAPDGVLPEPEIHVRLVEALGEYPKEAETKLKRSLKLGRLAFSMAFQKLMRQHPRLQNIAPVMLYRTIGETLPKGLESAAVLWVSAHMAAAKYPKAVKKAGARGIGPLLGESLFERILSHPSGVVFTADEYSESFKRLRVPDGKIQLAIPELLEVLEELHGGFETVTSADFPLVLAAGERRSYTANTIYRDPAWRKKDYAGALRISRQDADQLGLQDGDAALLSTDAGALEVTVAISPRMQIGTISLPNGQGLFYPDEANQEKLFGAAPNELTSFAHRDFFAGTPWHKHIPARLEKTLVQ